MVYDLEFDVLEEYLSVKAHGSSSLKNNIDLSRRIIGKCIECSRKKVLVDIRELKDPTGIADAYYLTEEVAPLSLGHVSMVALLHGVDRIELEAFLQTAMNNRGINLCSFLDEDKAMEWLLEKEMACPN